MRCMFLLKPMKEVGQSVHTFIEKSLITDRRTHAMIFGVDRLQIILLLI